MQARHFHLLFVFIFIVSFAQRAGAVEDGVYEIQYELLHASNDSVSIANDYFEKPAIWIVEGDEQYVQLTLNHSEWTKQLQAPVGGEYVDVTVIEEDRETDLRTIQFPLEQSIGEPVEMKMHVLIETMTPVYDHRSPFAYNSMNNLQSVWNNKKRMPYPLKRKAHNHYGASLYS